MRNASPFLSCSTVELQLRADACLLPGNQHSISPSTIQLLRHTRRVAPTDTHLCTQMRTSLSSPPGDFSKGCKWLPTAVAFFPPCLVVDLPFPLYLFRHPSPYSKLWHFPWFLKESFSADPSRGNRLRHTLTMVYTHFFLLRGWRFFFSWPKLFPSR